jgi:hypothetical protein
VNNAMKIAASNGKNKIAQGKLRRFSFIKFYILCSEPRKTDRQN